MDSIYILSSHKILGFFNLKNNKIKFVTTIVITYLRTFKLPVNLFQLLFITNYNIKKCVLIFHISYN